MSRLLLLTVLLAAMPAGAQSDNVTFQQEPGRVLVCVDGNEVATYVYDDPVVMRPFFCQVKTLRGVSVTRPYPPDPILNKGNDDHESMHPGIWLAFGDVNGVDYWRNKARVRHVRFEGPFNEGPVGTFAVVNRYEDPKDGKPICEETCSYSVRILPGGYLITANSSFKSDKQLDFGDQEEMGFGIRLNTPITVEFGSGEIKNSEGGLNEEGTWGKQAKWCAASGMVDGRRAGAMIIPNPANFRQSWFHSRDYGLIVANPFGKKSMTAPDDRDVPPDKTHPAQIGFGVFIFDLPQDQQPNYNQAAELFKAAMESHAP